VKLTGGMMLSIVKSATHDEPAPGPAERAGVAVRHTSGVRRTSGRARRCLCLGRYRRIDRAGRPRSGPATAGDGTGPHGRTGLIEHDCGDCTGPVRAASHRLPVDDAGIHHGVPAAAKVSSEPGDRVAPNRRQPDLTCPSYPRIPLDTKEEFDKLRSPLKDTD
jgi:hypothetical protein